MNSQSILIASLVVLAPLYTQATEENSAPVSQEEIISFFSQFPALQLTYHVTEDFLSGLNPEEAFEDLYREIALAEDILQRRVVDELLPEEEAHWADYPDSYLEYAIEYRRTFIESWPREAVYIYSSMGDYVRKDVIRIQQPEHSSVYLYKDNQTIFLDTQGEVVGPSLDRMFSNSGATILGLHHLLYRRHIVDANESTENRLVLRDRSHVRLGDAPHTFVMLNENPMFWKEYYWGSEEKPSIRILCENFANVDGFLAPQVIKFYNGPRLVLTKTLLDAKVNDASIFPDGFFDGAALPFERSEIASDRPMYLSR